jgi:hypothetical protein
VPADGLTTGVGKFSVTVGCIGYSYYVEVRRRKLISWTVSETVGYYCKLKGKVVDGIDFKTDNSFIYEFTVNTVVVNYSQF